MWIRLEVEIDDAAENVWVLRAIKLGFLRDDPTKRWGKREIRHAIRFAMLRVLEKGQVIE